MSNLDAFIEESNRIEGIRRKPRDHEIGAHETLLAAPVLTIGTLIHFVHVVAHAPLRRDPGNRTRLRLDVYTCLNCWEFQQDCLIAEAEARRLGCRRIPPLSMRSEKRTARSGTDPC